MRASSFFIFYRETNDKQKKSVTVNESGESAVIMAITVLFSTLHPVLKNDPEIHEKTAYCSIGMADSDDSL
jgi:predicted nucleic acid-binding protein